MSRKLLFCQIVTFLEAACTLHLAQTLKATTGPIGSFSGGSTHLTYLTTTSSGGSSIHAGTFYSHNSSSNTTTQFPSPSLIFVNKLRELKGANTPTNNSFIIQYSGSISLRVSNFTTVLYSFSFNSSSESAVSCYGDNMSTVYVAANLGSGTRIIDLGSGSVIAMLGNTSGKCIDIAYTNNRIFSLFKLNSMVYLLVHLTSDNSLNLNQSFSNPLMSSNLNIEVSNSYYSISFGPYVYIFNSSSYTSICNLTAFTQNVYDMKITQKWLYLSFSNKVQQYLISNCKLFGSYTTSDPKLIQTNEPNPSSNFSWIYLLTPTQSNITMLNVDDVYACTGGCTTCIDYYGLDAAAQCYYTGIPPISPSPSPSPSPSSPSLPSVPSPSLPSQPSTPSVANTSAILNSCFLENENQYCQIYCSSRCLTCNGSFDSCSVCQTHRVFGADNNCHTQFNMSLLYVALNVVNTFRPNSIQFIFYLLTDLEIYQYHLINYTGIFENSLDELNYLQNEKWTMFSIDEMLDWTQYWNITNSSYNFYTNFRILQIDRQSSFLLQNTKTYYILYLPLTLLLFLLTRQLFYCTSNYPISQIFRLYSFWLQYFFIILLSDSTKLCFLFFHYFRIVFSFCSRVKILHGVTVGVVGVFLVVLLSLFFMSSYLYDNLCKYFLVNVYRIRYSLAYNFLLYSLRPLVEASLHAFLFNDPKSQLISLASVQLFYLCLTLLFQFLFHAFKSKFIFVCAVLQEAGMILLNGLLYLKYIQFQDDGQIGQIVELCITCLLCIFITIFVLAFGNIVISGVVQIIRNNNEEALKKNIQSKPEYLENQILNEDSPKKQMKCSQKCQSQNSEEINQVVDCKKKTKQIYVKCQTVKSPSGLLIRQTKKNSQKKNSLHRVSSNHQIVKTRQIFIEHMG